MLHSLKKCFLTTLIVVLALSQTFAQLNESEDLENKVDCEMNYQIGSSLFMLYNFEGGENPPNYFQLNYGYRLSKRDLILVEAISWTYYEPLGTYGSSEENYPGKVRAYGIGAGYQRFIWNNLYAGFTATPFLQQYYDSENRKIQKGFQLYLQVLIGYRIELFNNRWFIEPAAAIKYWPVNTNMPAAFADIESGKPDYFFEPSLHFGFKF